MEYDQYWYWLNNIVGIGRQTIRYLLKIYGDPQAVYEADVHKAAEQINDERGRLAFLQSKDPVDIRRVEPVKGEKDYIYSSGEQTVSFKTYVYTGCPVRIVLQRKLATGRS